MSDHDLLHSFHRMSRLMRRARHHVDADSPQARLGLDPERGQGRILRLLQLRDGIPQRDIAYMLGLRPQSLGELIRKLETVGFIERRASDDDRRVHLVFLTEEGRAIADELAASPHGSGIDPFAALNEGEKKQLTQLLDKASCALAEQIGEEDGEQPWPHSPWPGGPHSQSTPGPRGIGRPVVRGPWA